MESSPNDAPVYAVLGATGGIGSELCRRLSARGANLALAAAATYLPRGLRVNVVAPGLVQTPMTENVTRSDAARQASLDLHPLGRLGEPRDVAAMVSWLLEPGNDWITGQTFGVDGGLSALRPMPRRATKSG